MSDSSEKNPMPEEIIINDDETHSSGTMLFTMLLLTAVFLFSSASLLHQSFKVRSPEGETIIDITTLVKSYQSRPALRSEKCADTTEEQEAQASPFDEIKNMMMNQTTDGKLRWPRLRITGAGKKSIEGTEDFAIINGDRVHPGEYAGKVLLVEVRSYDVVVVEYKGERRVLTVGLQD